jgi:hypothetical protein
VHEPRDSKSFAMPFLERTLVGQNRWMLSTGSCGCA